MEQQTNIKRILEALLFAADGPITVRQIRQICPEAEPAEIHDAVEELRVEYDREERSFHVVEIERGYQIFSKREYFPWIRKMRNDLKAMRLSRAAVETLAIVAYRQPVMRSEIEQIRGVDAGGVLKTLLERNLITLRGRAEGVGRPLLYGTTDFFLNHFGLKGLEELPRAEELTDLMRVRGMEEIEAVVEERLGPVEKDLSDEEDVETEEPSETEEPLETAHDQDGENGDGDTAELLIEEEETVSTNDSPLPEENRS